jgi:hypothetical protein
MKETTILCATDVTTVGNDDVLHFCDKESLNISLFETYSRKLYFLVALVKDATYSQRATIVIVVLSENILLDRSW